MLLDVFGEVGDHPEAHFVLPVIPVLVMGKVHLLEPSQLAVNVVQIHGYRVDKERLPEVGIPSHLNIETVHWAGKWPDQ